jgi:hypothetical protein
MRLAMWPHLLGVDVALVAVLWQELAGRALGTSTDLAERAVLFSAVWGIYLLDRAWDATRFAPDALAARRHQVARGRLPHFALLGIGNLALAGFLAFWNLNPTLLVLGISIAALCVGYYALHARSSDTTSSPRRALALAAIFSAAVLAAALVQSPPAERTGGFFLTLGFLLAANALECMRAEERLAGIVSPHATNTFLIVAAVISTAYALATGQFAALMSVACLGLLLFRQEQISPDAYTALADAALLVPVVCLLGSSGAG